MTRFSVYTSCEVIDIYIYNMCGWMTDRGTVTAVEEAGIVCREGMFKKKLKGLGRR